jgi:hypothetical protein
MTTTGHIAKAHREINPEKGLNGSRTHVVDVVGVGAGVYDRPVELVIPAVPYSGGEALFDKERFVNARAEDYGICGRSSRRVRSTSTSSTTAAHRVTTEADRPRRDPHLRLGSCPRSAEARDSEMDRWGNLRVRAPPSGRGLCISKLRGSRHSLGRDVGGLAARNAY